MPMNSLLMTIDCGVTSKAFRFKLFARHFHESENTLSGMRAGEIQVRKIQNTRTENCLS